MREEVSQKDYIKVDSKYQEFDSQSFIITSLYYQEIVDQSHSVISIIMHPIPSDLAS